MTGYLIRRLLQTLVVLWGVATIVFFLMHLSGDPVRLMLPPEASQEEVQRVRELLGLNRPLHEQYIEYFARAVRGDLGESIRHGESALGLIVERLPATIELTLGALLVSMLIALPLGTLSAMYRGTAIDSLSAAVALFGQCIPTFFLGIVLILVFAVNWGMFPALGAGTFSHLVLPSITLGAYTAALTTRMLRSSLLDVFDQDYVRTARAKGLPARTILMRHVARNAAIPVLTIVGLQIGVLVSGAVVTETVFNYPGIGLLVINAVEGRDFTLVQAFVIVVALLIVAVNFLVDVLYVYLDPRIRLD